MNNPLVSIIIPVYNVEDFVEKCLESAYLQSYENIELIVVDDGSTDKSSVICDDFAKNKKNVKVFHNKNGGLSFARNFGIKKASGELIALVDSDDFVEKDFIEKMIEALEKDGSDVVVCGFDEEKPERKILSGKEATIKLLVEQENLEMVAWNKLYKKDLFIKNNIWYPVGEKNEDSLTTYKILSKAKKISYIPEILYNYIKRDGSIMNATKIEERLIMRERAGEESIKFFVDDKDLKDAAEIALLTAKFAFVDASLIGKLDKKFYKENIDWIKKHTNEYLDNKYLTRKLKIYLKLVKIFNGDGYKLFRKVKRPDL